MDDNTRSRLTLEEKISLSDRFGLSIGFYRITQETFFSIVQHLVEKRGLNINLEFVRREALQWLQNSSGRSGRVARQYVDDLEGRLKLNDIS